MSEINPSKLQKPLKDKNGSFYPLTCYDQIIMPDGISRWDGNSDGVYVERDGAENSGLPVPNDADTLGGIPAKDYALKSDIPNNTNSTVTWEDIQNKPEELANLSTEEWVFTLENGSTVTKTVVISI